MAPATPSEVYGKEETRLTEVDVKRLTNRKPVLMVGYLLSLQGGTSVFTGGTVVQAWAKGSKGLPQGPSSAAYWFCDLW